MVKKKKTSLKGFKRLVRTKLRKPKIITKGKRLTVVVKLPQEEKSEPLPFFKKVIQEDRRNFFFR